MTSPEFLELSDGNIEKYLISNYKSPQCLGLDNIEEDINHIKYLKRLFNKFMNDGEFKARLALNHIITLRNIFGVGPIVRILFYKIDESYHHILRECLIYLKYVGYYDRFDNIDIAVISECDDIRNCLEQEDI